jgi:hypothetical protein
MDKYWNELIYDVTKGNILEMQAIKKFDIIEFYDYINNKCNG